MKTEKEKMLAGEVYDCADNELLTRWHKAKQLQQEYNNTLTTDAGKISDLLDKLDVQTLSVDPFINNAGKEYESKKEKWYRLKVRCSYELGDYAKCVEYANNAFAQPIKWHYNNLNWVKYYRASSLVQLKRYEEAENEFLSLGNRIPNVDSFEVLYDLYMNTGKEKEAYTNLVYKFFTSGYNVQHLSLYEKILEMTHAGKNSEVAALADAFVYKVKEETGKDLTGASISDEYKDMNSSTLYDRFYNQLMENLDAYIERYEGKVVYYNKDKEFGSIYQDDDDNLFFRQADYIYDEVVEKRDVVEYSVMKTFDAKKQRPTTKAILLKTLYEDINY